MCGCLSHHLPTGDLAPNPGVCPDWELNQRPFGLLSPLSHTSQGGVYAFPSRYKNRPQSLSDHSKCCEGSKRQGVDGLEGRVSSGRVVPLGE